MHKKREKEEGKSRKAEKGRSRRGAQSGVCVSPICSPCLVACLHLACISTLRHQSVCSNGHIWCLTPHSRHPNSTKPTPYQLPAGRSHSDVAVAQLDLGVLRRRTCARASRAARMQNLCRIWAGRASPLQLHAQAHTQVRMHP